eukprot:TRINITY_DN3685_c0_g1_i1.p1 TRINITY_DN3685_c0_g1~~TRINITY_DN3685_c0_g1_i1.p1  ORF type:complete len:443 (-),score=130.16 TRINITY_DN3685_c0_g1_i1:99-1427(-)
MINANHMKIWASAYLMAVAVYVKMSSSSFLGMIGKSIIALIAPIALVAVGFILLGLGVYAWSVVSFPEKPADLEQYIVFKDEALKAKYAHTAAPIYDIIEAYFVGKLDFKMDFLALMKAHRHQIFRMCFVPAHLNFLFGKLFPQAFDHSRGMDHGEIAHVYDRGNDFYGWFLGPSMVYTSGIFNSPEDTLEEAQKRKLDLICEKLHLRDYASPKMLDIGCGWGTLSCHAAKYFNATVKGISLAQEQVNFGLEQAKTMGVADRVDLQVMDYRLLPEEKFDAISCVEMAEHVGIWKFQEFLDLVKARLTDEGLFYLQIAGLRRAWQFEDFVWGMFMGTYIFPAADASCPLGWVINMLESRKFEVRSSETVGIHYSWTIHRWYNNWISNKDAVVAKYGEWWFRLWVVFLGWSVIIAAQGSSTCYQIVAHKNLSEFDRTKFIGRRP